MIFSKSTLIVLATVLLAFTSIGSALACSTAGWDETSGAVVVGSPFGATPPDENGISRFEEFCALRANGTGHVQTNAPAHERVITAFYSYPELSVVRGAVDASIFVAFSSEVGSGELYRIGYDGSNWIIDATANGGTQTLTPATAGWNRIETDWDPASGTLDFWVNDDPANAPTGSVDPGGMATMQSARLGLPDGLGNLAGEVYLDTFKMHNTTAIGPLIHCDADGDTMVNVNDAVAVVDEIFGIALAQGVPDCDLSGGALDVNDAVAIVDKIFGG